jgi:hypothetical protein
VSNETVESLARGTRGLYREEFDAALERFRQAGEIPREDTARPPVDVELDIIEEGFVSPPAIRTQLLAAGFSDVRVHPVTTRSRSGRPLQPLARLWPSAFRRIPRYGGYVVFDARA